MKISVCFLFIVTICFAVEAGGEARVLPRFSSLSSSHVFVRVGPGKLYKIAWEFKCKSLPVEVILEYDHWRKIRDHEGAEGWIHKSMLCENRTVLFLRGRHCLYSSSAGGGKIIAYVEGNVIGRFVSCAQGRCFVEVQKVKGWVDRSAIWGTYPHESSRLEKCFLGLPFFCRKAAAQ